MRKSNILAVVMWVAFVVNFYFWFYIFLGLLSLFGLGMRKELIDLYYLSWMLDGLCLGVAFIWRTHSNYFLDLRRFYVVTVFVLVATLASFLIRWIDYLGDDSGEIFWFEPLLRGGSYLAMLILFIGANYNKLRETDIIRK